MARIVVVSTAEIREGALGTHVLPTDELVVVVPAVEQSRLDWLTNDEGDAREHAQHVGEAIASDAPGSEASVEVTSDVPSQAVLDAIAEHEPDRIIVALRDGEDATWLEEGELAQVPGEIAGVPVTRVRL
ncbi:MAG TPA: hypothetical protein VMK83_07750 [Gaiellaceae bacterium]|nr:hypothetical protein [Gaiellaceae bacterium]